MKTRNKLKFFLLLTLLANLCLSGFALALLPLAEDPAQTIEAIIEPFDKPESPGGAILVMRHGEVIYSKAFGMANLTHNIPFELSTPTNIGSTSKQFTAFAIALLEERGLLSLEDDIRKHIPELPDLGDTVRIWHLISHSSGYREYLNAFAMAGRMLGDKLRREEIIPLVQRQPALQNAPGKTFNYNNTGYALLAMVVERVTESDFPDWMRDNVFEPLGMQHTRVRSNPGAIIQGHAQGYSVSENGEATDAQDLYASMGAGGIYTTVEDLIRWVNNFYEPVLGSPETMEKLQTMFLLSTGAPTFYGYGLFIDELKGLKIIHHGGADTAHRSQLILIPSENGAVIVQSNHSGFPMQSANKITEAFFSDVMTPEEQEEVSSSEEFVFDPENFDELAGRYELEAAPGFILEFSREDDKLYTQASGQPQVEIFASSDSTFYLTVVEASVTFHRDENGGVSHITLHQNGNHRATRITEPEKVLSAEELNALLGRYYSYELDAFYEVAADDNGKPVLRHRRLDDIPLKHSSGDEFIGAFPMLTINFLRNDQGEVTGFEASSGRSFGIVFDKQTEDL